MGQNGEEILETGLNSIELRTANKVLRKIRNQIEQTNQYRQVVKNMKSK